MEEVRKILTLKLHHKRSCIDSHLRIKASSWMHQPHSEHLYSHPESLLKNDGHAERSISSLVDKTLRYAQGDGIKYAINQSKNAASQAE
jgi:hypothetical protein